MDPDVTAYIDGIAPEHRAMFDRVHGLILQERPDAGVTISYGIPTYKVGKSKLYVGAWKHGLSLYGWRQGRDGGFVDRHPELLKPKATIQLRPADAEKVSDAELVSLIDAVLS